MTYVSAGHPMPGAAIGSHGVLLGTALRFGLVGVGGTAVNMLALHVLHGLGGLSILVASPLAVELAIVHNFLLNDWWTFRSRSRRRFRFARFNLSTSLTLVVNVAVVWTLVGAGIGYLAANLVGIGVGAALNFGASHAWVWEGGP